MKNSHNSDTNDLLNLQKQVQEAIVQIINAHVYNPDLNTLLHRFVSYKEAETSVWTKLTLYTHFMMGGNSPHIFHAAAQTELIILSLDIFDDLQDQDNFAPPWMSCEPNIAMNAASTLLITGVAGDLQLPLPPSLLKLISTAHNGQHNDIRNVAAGEEDYLQLVKENSSALISLAMQMGFQLIEKTDIETSLLLNEMADHIGIAAQLQNDIKDITILDNRNDIIQRKRTIATLYLLDQSKSSFTILHEYYDDNCDQLELLAHEQALLAFIRTSGVVEYSNTVQFLYVTQASEQLDRLAILPQWKERFKEIAIYPFLNKN